MSHGVGYPFEALYDPLLLRVGRHYLCAALVDNETIGRKWLDAAGYITFDCHFSKMKAAMTSLLYPEEDGEIDATGMQRRIMEASAGVVCSS